MVTVIRSPPRWCITASHSAQRQSINVCAGIYTSRPLPQSAGRCGATGLCYAEKVITNERSIAARTCRPSPSGGSRTGGEKKKNHPTSAQSRIYTRNLHPAPATNHKLQIKKIIRKNNNNMRPITQLPRLLRPASSRHGSSASSERWTARATRDHFTKEAQLKGYKSRAAMKLIEMNQKHKLFSAGMTVVDLVRPPPRSFISGALAGV